MAHQRDAIRVAAGWASAALSASGYEADFTPKSLAALDAFFEDEVRARAPRRRGLLATEREERLQAFDIYVGEVIRRAAGGAWLVDGVALSDASFDATTDASTDEEQARPALTLRLADGSVVDPVARVLARFAGDIGAGLVGFGVECGVAPPVPDPEPVRPRRRFLSRASGAPRQASMSRTSGATVVP